jgi:hypothetical protein
MEQDMVLSKPAFDHSIRSFTNDRPLEGCLLSNAEKPEEVDEHYFSSILKVPEFRNIRCEIIAITRHFSASEQKMLRISDFSSKRNIQMPNCMQVQQVDDLTKPNQQSTEPVKPAEEPIKSTQPTAQNSFRLVTQPETPCNRTSDNFSDFFEDFECSMEEVESFEQEAGLDVVLNPMLTFSFGSHNKSATFRGQNSFELKKLIHKLQNRNTITKVYTCDMCGKSFNNHAALGGHKAKNHPHSSKSFTERKKTFELRKAERTKRDFLRNF